MKRTKQSEMFEKLMAEDIKQHAAIEAEFLQAATDFGEAQTKRHESLKKWKAHMSSAYAEITQDMTFVQQKGG